MVVERQADRVFYRGAPLLIILMFLPIPPHLQVITDWAMGKVLSPPPNIAFEKFPQDRNI